MLRAIELARKGELTTQPNPMVGCVIVKNNTIIGEGWHQSYGGHHAEVEAIKSCKKDLVQSRRSNFFRALIYMST
ncbi:hypothetical protein N8472_01885 [Gammaproteobacteria bacterium]|nr:hypothetical protein [Gammaproteobacteria bacterium]